MYKSRVRSIRNLTQVYILGEVLESGDWVANANIEYKPGTDERYLVLNLLKRRSVESGNAEMIKYTYLAHPFAKNNGLRLLDDLHLDRVLSLQSLATDIEGISEKQNAVPRLKTIKSSEFEEFDD